MAFFTCEFLFHLCDCVWFVCLFAFVCARVCLHVAFWCCLVFLGCMFTCSLAEVQKDVKPLFLDNNEVCLIRLLAVTLRLRHSVSTDIFHWFH